MSSYATAKSKREQYAALYTALKTERAPYDAFWQDLADNYQPTRTKFNLTETQPKSKRNSKILDSTGRLAARTLASGLHAGLTSPARPWMRLTTPDPSLAESGQVKAWLHLVTQRMLTLMLQANLYNALPIVYGDMGIFATGCMAVIEDTEDLFRCYTYPTGSYVLGLDARGVATTFLREYQLTVRQVIETFGVEPGYRDIDWSKISNVVKTLYERGDYETKVTICWVVLPNDNARRDRLDAKYLPWSSCHYEVGEIGKDYDGRFLRESGFNTFPILAPRWDVTSPEDVYGQDSPGMTAIGDVHSLQTMQRWKAKAIAKMVDPPLSGPSVLRSSKVSSIPGDITYVDVREGQQGLKSIYDVNIRIDHLVQDIQEHQYRIKRVWFEDLFLMLATLDPMAGAQPKTAREVQERHEEKFVVLGPVLERTNDELLDPLVDRLFSIMLRAGLIPPPPQELSGVKLKVEYISILAQAQKLVGVVGQDRFLQSTLGLAEFFPEVRHKVDIFRVMDNYGDMLGVDPRIVRPTEEAQQLLEADRQAAQAAQEAEQAKTIAQATHLAGNTPMEGDTALSRLVSGVTNG